MNEWLIPPNLDNQTLSSEVTGLNEIGKNVTLNIIEERAHTLFLNGQEIITNMTIGDYPEYLALGYLANQRMLGADEKITSVEHDAEIGVTVVRTDRPTNFEAKLKKKIHTSGCAQGTLFADVMEEFNKSTLPDHISEAGNTGAVLPKQALYDLIKVINMTPSLYLETGAIHGCVLCAHDRPLVYMEDVGRHNAVDKIAGFMLKHEMNRHDKILYTTGRLTSEMVIKCALMEVPILISRSGFTAFGVKLAQKVNLTLIGRAKGHRFTILSAPQRIAL